MVEKEKNTQTIDSVQEGCLTVRVLVLGRRIADIKTKLLTSD